MRTLTQSLRTQAFGGSERIRLERVLRNGVSPVHHKTQLRIYSALSAVLVMSAAFGYWKLDGHNVSQMTVTPPALQTAALKPIQNSVVKLPLPDREWTKIGVSSAPAVMKQISIESFRFQNKDMLPVAHLDRVDVDGKLPRVLWVKLQQPGNAILVVETTEGTIVRALEEVSPGEISRCNLDNDSFGTVDGQPLLIDRDTLKVDCLWVVQDASATTKQAPGWIAAQ